MQNLHNKLDNVKETYDEKCPSTFLLDDKDELKIDHCYQK